LIDVFPRDSFYSLVTPLSHFARLTLGPIASLSVSLRRFGVPPKILLFFLPSLLLPPMGFTRFFSGFLGVLASWFWPPYSLSVFQAFPRRCLFRSRSISSPTSPPSVPPPPVPPTLYFCLSVTCFLLLPRCSGCVSSPLHPSSPFPVRICPGITVLFCLMDPSAFS